MRFFRVILVALLFIGPIAHGQIYSGENFPSIGQYFPLLADTAPYPITTSLVLGPAPWHLAQAAAHLHDTVYFLDPTTTQLAGSFPTSFLAQWSPHVEDEVAEEFFYLSESNGNLLCQGSSLTPDPGLFFEFKYNKPLMWMNFPVQLGASGADSAWAQVFATGVEVGEPADSIRYISHIYRFDTVDAVGTIHLPGLILENAIRRIRTDSTVDTLFTKTNGTWSYDPADIEVETKNCVEWYHPEKDWMIAQASIGKDGNIHYFRYMPGLPPTIRLEISGLPDHISVNDTITGCQVKAYNMATGELDTAFSDSIYLYTYPWLGPHVHFSETALKAVNGIVTFDKIWFQDAGEYRFLAKADTVMADTSHIVHVLLEASHLKGSIESYTYLENQTLDPITVTALTSMNSVDSLFFQGLVHIGKLSGPGEILGTKTKFLTQGFTTFDDIRLSHQGTYELVLYTPSAAHYHLESDTLTVTVNPNPGNWAFHYTDTLSEYVDRAHEFYWIGNLDGYLSGTSRGRFSEIGQHFDFNGQARLTKVRIHFANRMYVGDNTDTFEIKVYDAGLLETTYRSHWSEGPTFADSLPNRLLGSQYFAADSIVFGDYWIQRPTTIAFDIPPIINSGFIISVVTDSELSNDTIVLWTSIPGDGQQEYRTSRLAKLSDTTQTFTWIRDKYWRPSYNVDLMIEAVLEVDTLSVITDLTGLDRKTTLPLYPNPTSGIVAFTTPPTTQLPCWIEIYDTKGARIYTERVRTAAHSLNLEQLVNGEYLIVLRDNNGSPSATGRVIKME